MLLGYTVVTSPYDGVVTKRHFSRGDFVRGADSGGERVPLLAVERTDLMRVVVQVPDRDVPYVTVGDPAALEIDALPGRNFTAKVSRYADSEDPASRLMRTEVDVPNPDGVLRRGMYGRATLTLATGADARRCGCRPGRVDKSGKKPTVRVVRDGAVRAVPVNARGRQRHRGRGADRPDGGRPGGGAGQRPDPRRHPGDGSLTRPTHLALPPGADLSPAPGGPCLWSLTARMNGIVRFALGNPRAVTVLVLTILLAGVVALAVIPADILPVYKSPAVQVMTFYGGMSATNVEADITSRMERQTGQAAGTARQESRSVVGASIIRNYYADGTDPSGALTQVNSLATAAIPNLPPGTLPPVILPYDPTSATPVCIVALNSKTQGESVLYDTARYQVRNMIMASPGANAPVVYGGKLRTVLAYLDRQKLQARNLSPVDVMDALDRSNVFLPAGDAKLGGTDYALDSNSMYELVERMGDIPIRADRTGTVFLRDVALPKDAALVQTNVVRVDGRRQVYVPVYRQQGSSTLGVVGNLSGGLADMQARLTTPDVDLKLVFDQSVYVKQSIISLAEEGVLGAVLCSLVILLFLGEWRMTVIAVITVPVAVLGAITGLMAVGQSINVMTLAGLALAVGPLVDSAIVALENTHRHLGLGERPRVAAYKGASEVAMPALAATLCTLLVLAPLALIPGLGAFLFQPMFLAVAFAVLVAYALSLTFVPARCAAWLRPHAHHGHAAPQGPLGRAFARWEGVIDAGIRGYLRLLGVALRFRRTVVVGAFAALAAVLVLVGPQADAEYALPAQIGDYTDFYISIHHATRVGRLFRPDAPLLPNYKWVPIGYHGRASSIGISGQQFPRPVGQTLPAGASVPIVGPSKRLDYELEVGIFIGLGNDLGAAIPIADAEAHVFGLCLFNDWSARDIQAWEYQPLGPFLAKSFASTVSPWVVTMEALAPYRTGWSRDPADPQPLPYLDFPALRETGAIDIELEVLLETQRMRTDGTPPLSLSRSNFRDAYWSIAHLVAHHTINGCNLRPGDLLGSGTQSGPTVAEAGSLLELTNGGKEPLQLPGGETRTFLEDGDEVIMRGFCSRPGFARIGFGELAGRVLPPNSA